MNAKELMIGDWVYCEGQPTPDNVKIQSIHEDGVWFQGKEFEGAASYDRIFPIPITPEILEKNGFTYCKSDGGFYLYTTISYGNWDVDVVLFDVTDEYRNNQLHISSPDDSYIAIHLMECNHVHELQHALRLCGIKKEISLC